MFIQFDKITRQLKSYSDFELDCFDLGQKEIKNEQIINKIKEKKFIVLVNGENLEFQENQKSDKELKKASMDKLKEELKNVKDIEELKIIIDKILGIV